jgi:hypothetical protein
MVPFLSGNEQLRRLVIAYLFLSVDRPMSDADYSIFEELGSSLEDIWKFKSRIIEASEELLEQENPTKSRYEIVSDALKEYEKHTTRSGGISDSVDIFKTQVSQLGFFSKGLSDITSSNNTLYKGDKGEEQRSYLWMLLSLLYQPGVYSESRQNLVSLWQENSEYISEIVYIQMVDIIKTLNAIKEHKEWLETTNGLPHEHINTMQAELDKNLKDIQTSVSSLITLG